MASQRTAFAIPAAGPVQGDDFPILEYAAPRAFYIYLHNRGVFRLQSFDERTWQMDLAPDGVNKDLAKLDPPALKSIFATDGSVNEDLILCLQGVYAHYAGGEDFKPIMIGNHAMPCSLLGTNRNVEAASPPSAATNAITRQLVMSDSQKLDWSPAYYADVGVKASLRLSDPGRAKTILLRALQLEPESDQLQYLSRILIREKVLQPPDLARP